MVFPDIQELLILVLSESIQSDFQVKKKVQNILACYLLSKKERENKNINTYLLFLPQEMNIRRLNQKLMKIGESGTELGG